MIKTEIIEKLYRMQDEGYAKMQRKIIPTVPADSIIGVRLPELRAFAKELYKTGRAEVRKGFLTDLPHRYLDENMLHAIFISLEKDFDVSLGDIEAFLPYTDNWAVCDTLLPAAFARSPERILPNIENWLASERTYTVRFAVSMLMRLFLVERFKTEYADMVAAVRSDEYYVNMMSAWYFATALAKQYDAIIPYVEQGRLTEQVHSRTIQKAVESYRISPERKEYLKTLRTGGRKR